LFLLFKIQTHKAQPKSNSNITLIVKSLRLLAFNRNLSTSSASQLSTSIRVAVSAGFDEEHYFVVLQRLETNASGLKAYTYRSTLWGLFLR
jgi:hypothetical protein